MKLKPIACYEAVPQPRQADCEVCHGRDSWLKCVCMVKEWIDVPVDGRELEVIVKEN